MKIYKLSITIFLLLSFEISCNYKFPIFPNKYSEELILKEKIISSPEVEILKEFMEKYSYSTFSYYLMDKFDLEKSKKYKIDSYRKSKIYNQFLILKELKEKFYSTLDRNLALEIANIYKKCKKYKRAKIFYLFTYNDKIYNAKSINKKILLERARISFQNKNFSEAKIYYKKLLMYSESLNKKNFKYILLKLGEIEFFQSNFTSSVEYLMKAKKILRVEEKNICLYYLALCYYKTKEYKNASKYFEKIKELYPFTAWEKKASIYIDDMKSEVQYDEQ